VLAAKSGALFSDETRFSQKNLVVEIEGLTFSEANAVADSFARLRKK
jgi:hypothetical protein